MKRPRRKTSSQKATDKVEKRKEEQYQGMSIRGIINKNKQKEQEEEKNRTTNTGLTNSIPKINATNQPTQEEVQKITATYAAGTTGIPEIFDSSKYNSMTEIKQSGNVKEGHLKEVLLSDVQQQEPIKAENVNINTNNPSTNIDTNSSQPSPSISNVEPNIEERAAMLRGSKEVGPLEQDLESNNNNSRQKEGGGKEKHDEREVVDEASSPIISPKYTTSSWLELANTWTNLYIESAKNAGRMTEYWLDLFSKPWFVGYKRKDKVKVE
jgi:hypothetical protein